MASAPPTDPVSIIVAIGATLGVSITHDLSAYALIAIASTGGAAWAATGQSGMTKTRAAMFVLGRVGLALLIGGYASMVLGSWTGIDWRWMVGPAAGFIAAVGPTWIVDRVKGWVSKRSGAEGGTQ